jgi:hypothetical protein
VSSGIRDRSAGTLELALAEASYTDNVNSQAQISKDPRTQSALAEWLGARFKEVDWLVPPYLRVEFLSGLAHAIEMAPPPERLQVMQVNLAHAYGPDYLAGMFLERYSKITYVRDFEQHIGQSIRAYFSGYKLVAVIALVPVLEGVVRKIAASHGRHIGAGTKKLNDEFKAFVDAEIESPRCFGERVVMLEALRDFVRDRLLEPTDSYSGLNELNRHGILHGIYGNFGEDMNFFRLITLLDLLCFAIGGSSAFGPAPTPESLRLAEHYKRLKALSRT